MISTSVFLRAYELSQDLEDINRTIAQLNNRPPAPVLPRLRDLNSPDTPKGKAAWEDYENEMKKYRELDLPKYEAQCRKLDHDNNKKLQNAEYQKKYVESKLDEIYKQMPELPVQYRSALILQRIYVLMRAGKCTPNQAIAEYASLHL